MTVGFMASGIFIKSCLDLFPNVAKEEMWEEYSDLAVANYDELHHSNACRPLLVVISVLGFVLFVLCSGYAHTTHSGHSHVSQMDANS